MDSYQAVYDAVRSRISNGDVGNAIEQAIRGMNISHYADMAGHAVQEAAMEYTRPSVMFRPEISMDGNKWCALYGQDLVQGVAGFGDSVAEAMYDFDKNWRKKIGTP